MTSKKCEGKSKSNGNNKCRSLRDDNQESKGDNKRRFPSGMTNKKSKSRSKRRFPSGMTNEKCVSNDHGKSNSNNKCKRRSRSLRDDNSKKVMAVA